MRTVRTTMQPDTVITVSEQEYTDLRRRKLLVDDGPAPAADLEPSAAELVEPAPRRAKAGSQ